MKQINSLQKSYDPFANGRWYRVFLESNGTNCKVTESDILHVLCNNGVLIIPKGYMILSFIVKPHLIKTTATINTNIYLYAHTDNTDDLRVTLSIPKNSQFDFMEIFLFCEDSKND